MDKIDNEDLIQFVKSEMLAGEIKNQNDLIAGSGKLFTVELQKDYNNPIINSFMNLGLYAKVLVIVITTLVLFLGCKIIFSRGISGQVIYNGISAKEDPVQTKTEAKSFNKAYGDIGCTIIPQADYKITAKVQSKHKISYWSDTAESLSKYDLALSWGELINSKYDKYISYSQTGRQYMFMYKDECPLTGEYISEHSANTHIIAANNNILSGVKDIKEGDIVYLEGYLVNVFMNNKGNSYEWNTSLARNDNSYNSGCEILYVNKLMIGKDTYE